MSISLTGPGTVALFDSVTGYAFGPTFDSHQDALSFLTWSNTLDIPDLRMHSDKGLQDLYDAWLTHQDES